MRHSLKTLASVLAVGAFAATGLAGCAGGGSSESGVDASKVKDQEVSGNITFQTWSLKNEKFTPYFEKLIADFQKENPKVKVKWMDQPGDGYEEKILQQANSEQLPDVVNLPPEYGAPLAKAGKLLDLAKADKKTLEGYVDGGVEAYQYHGVDGSFGYPWYLGVAFNYWNTDALQKAGLSKDKLPTSDDELYAAAEKAAQQGVTLMNTRPDLGYLASRGVKVWDPSSRKFVFNNEDAQKLLQRYADLYKKHGVAPEMIGKADDGAQLNEAFYKGTLGGLNSTPSFASDIKKDAPSVADKVVVNEPWETPNLLVQGISVSANSKNPAAALAFAQYVTNNANQEAFVKIAKGFLPGTKEGNNDPNSFISDEDTPLVKEAIKTAASTAKKAKRLTPIELSEEMKTAYLQQITAAMQGDISVSDALDKAVEECNKLVEDNE